MKNIKKILVCLIIIIAIISCIHIVSYGTTDTGLTFDDPIEDPNSYIPATNWRSDNAKLIEIGGIIIGVIQALGSAAAVIALMVLGIKYMIGSTQDKANYKEAMVPYLIGAIMVFTITNVLGIFYDLIVQNLRF